MRQRHWFEGRPTVPGGPKDLAWIHPAGHEMTGDDWHDAGLRVIGMFVSGSPMRSPGPRGEVQSDSSFLIWFNGSADPADCSLPPNDWVQQGEVVLSTDPAHAVGTPVAAGESIRLDGRSMVVLREA